MTNTTTTPDGYERIDWPEVRKGDVLMHENGDRLTVSAVSEVDHDGYRSCWVAGSWHPVSTLEGFGFTPYRRKPEMPTEPGAYLDKDGVLCVRQSEESAKGDIVWCMPEGGGPIGLWQTSEEMERCAPFTRLVPMPTEDQIHAAVYNALRGSGVDGMYPLRTINAVMALLTGKEKR